MIPNFYLESRKVGKFCEVAIDFVLKKIGQKL